MNDISMKTKKTNYSKVGLYYLIGTFFQKGIIFLTVPIFTRIMGTDDYGIINTYNSWLGIVSMFISAALYMSLRLAFVEYKDDINNFLATIISFALVTGAFFLGIAIIVGSISGNNEFRILSFFCVIHATSEAVITDVTQFFVMQYKYKIRTLLMIVPPFLAVVFSIIAILLINQKKYMGRIIPTALTMIFCATVLIIYTYRKSSTFAKKEYIVYGLKISAPLIVHGVALNILSSSDRIMITNLRSADETGIYSLIYNISMIATVITVALDGIWSPWFIGKMSNKDNDKKQMIGDENDITSINCYYEIYIFTITVLISLLLLVSPEIVKIFADSRYWEGIPIIPPVVISSYFVFIYSFFVGIEHYYKKTIFISINTIIAAIINIILNYCFIPTWGYSAAAYTTLASYFVALVMHIISGKRIEKRLFGIKTIIINLTIVLFTSVIFYMFVEKTAVRFIISLIYIFCFGIKNRNLIVNCIKGILNRQGR